MRHPQFWYREPGLQSWMLAPLASIWEFAARIRSHNARPGSASVPVVCIGNANVGGTGKTPLAIALAERLAEAGRAPHLVTRGYRGRERGPLLVDVRQHPASRVGDEPLLLAAFAPTWVARDRLDGARRAAASGATEVILDDGHQYSRLIRDLTILTVKAATGFGNGKVIPAGPLREELGRSLSRADILVVVGARRDFAAFRKNFSGRATLPMIQAELTPLQTGIDWNGMPVVAFAGIGQPEGFFATVADAGAEIRQSIALGDHQPLGSRLMRRLESLALSHKAQLVTTEKDAVRLPREWRSRVLTLPVRMRLDSWREIDAKLREIGILESG